MAYQALARKYRPQTFDDIIGQHSLVQTLQNAIAQQRVHHAYLFSGVRGVGKTTTARIFAKALNCQSGPTPSPCNRCVICQEITEGIDLDVREIDAATYSKAEDVRDLRELMQFQPIRDRRRVFIIDEVHSLSAQAWNALLKQVEEPPPHVVFIMATTEMHKVPQTILSRVQRFVLQKITPDEVQRKLASICQAEGITAEPEALDVIARRGEGSVRDSLSLLDQVIAFTGRTFGLGDVATILGLSDSRFFARVAQAIDTGDTAAILELTDEAAAAGRDFKLLYRDLLSFFRNLLAVATGADRTGGGSEMPDAELIARTAAQFDPTEIVRVLNVLLQDDEIISRCEHQRLAVEVAILKAATLPRLRAVEQFLGGSADLSPEPKRARALPVTQGRSVTAAASTQAAPEPQAVSPGDLPARFVERVRAERRIAASYLDQAKSIEVDGNAILIRFDPSQSLAAEFLDDETLRPALDAAASEVAGQAVSVRIERQQPPEQPQPRRRETDDDPVFRAFAKHLGGEIVPPRTHPTQE